MTEDEDNLLDVAPGQPHNNILSEFSWTAGPTR